MSKGGKRTGAGRPKLPDYKKKVSVTTRIYPHTYERIKDLADTWNTTISDAIRIMLKDSEA